MSAMPDANGVRIRVLDLETTGTEPEEARICEYGWCDVVAQNRDLLGEPYDWTIEEPPRSLLVNPGHMIPPEVSAIHHIIDGDVAGQLQWDTPLKSIVDPGWRHEDEPPWVALVAHSAKFERSFISDDDTGGLPWICTYKCGLRLWPDAPSHSNQALRYWRKPVGLKRDLADRAHRAGPDAYVTAHLVRDMLNDGASVALLIQWSSEPALQVRCHIGKWRGTPWAEVDLGFLYWVYERDFDEDVMFTVRTEIERRQREQAASIPDGEDHEE